MNAFGERKTTLIAISVDPVETSRELAKKLSLTFPLLSDPSLTAVRAWGVEDKENAISWPSMFVIAPSGKIVWRSLADTYKVRATTDQFLAAIDGIREKR